jgi:hypothetical protein
MATKHMSPAEREAREMIAEMKMQKAAEAAYNRADQTEPAPMVEPTPRPAPRPMPRAMPAMPQDQMGNSTGMKKGGSVFRSSANGIAQRGKTKGTMVTMCGGGKM